LAEQIRDLFPALVQIEDLKPASDDVTGPFAPRSPLAEGGRLERLGDYRILREVGRGGMGVVYEAEQESLGRHVALKVLPSSALIDPRHLARFEREARAAARLHHTNIVPVFGVGEHDGLHYYVMQFIQGQGLHEVIAELSHLRGPKGGGAADAVPPPDAPAPSDHSGLSDSGRAYWQSVARIGVQAAEALAYANGQGVLHRDVKPSNLLLDAQGAVWVTDFGLAKASDSADLTHPATSSAPSATSPPSASTAGPTPAATSTPWD
jgi:serine/threonine protein kinase